MDDVCPSSYEEHESDDPPANPSTNHMLHDNQFMEKQSLTATEATTSDSCLVSREEAGNQQSQGKAPLLQTKQ